MPVFGGPPCRPRDGFVSLPAPGSDVDACVRNWRCADGDQRYQPDRRIGDALRWGGPEGVHRCLDGEAPGPGYICDTGRRAQDAYGRPLGPDGSVICGEDCQTMDAGEPWRAAGICGPVWCAATPAPTVQPTAGPTPQPGLPPPTLVRQKVQNVDNKPNRWDPENPRLFGCHNPAIGDQFAKHNRCENGSTPLLEGNAQTGFQDVGAGPCDPEHAKQWLTFCNQKEYNVPPRFSVTGAADWHVSDENPHHVIVTFIPGQCYTVCAWSEPGDKTSDGIALPIGGNTKTCAEHCY